MATTYDQGDVVHCACTFTNSIGVAIDPAAVTFKLIGPNDTLVYVYGTDAALVRTALGCYSVDVSVPSTGSSAAGTYTYRFESTGTGQAAGEATFVVRNSGIYG